MSTEASSRAIAFDPQGATLPDELTPPRTAGVRVIALLVHDEVRTDGWGERAARALARGWAALGQDVILVDGDLSQPTLHSVLGVPNGEGMADALLFGASPARVSVDVAGEPFRFVPAGTVMADPSAGWQSPRWNGLLEGFRAEGTSVFLFLPAGGEGVARLADVADRVLELGRGGGAGELLVPGSRLLYPARGPDAAGEHEMEGPAAAPPGLTGPTQDTIGEKPERRAQAPPTGATPPDTRTATSKRAPIMVSPTGSGSSPRRVKRRLAPWILVVLILVVVLAVAVWQGLIPGVRLPGGSAFGLPIPDGWFL